jgi:hypothetical protein
MIVAFNKEEDGHLQSGRGLQQVERRHFGPHRVEREEEATQRDVEDSRLTTCSQVATAACHP